MLIFKKVERCLLELCDKLFS